jgi:hypothetical protein
MGKENQAGRPMAPQARCLCYARSGAAPIISRLTKH